MFTYYLVANTYSFGHYGEALAFARRIGGNIEVRKTWNIFKLI